MQPIEKALRGQRIVITRAEEGAASFADRLRRLGAEPIICPTITVRAPEDYGPLDRALGRLAQREYTWTIFTSANGVQFTLARARELSYDAEIFATTRLAVIGPATARALAQHGLHVDYMPREYLTDAIAESLGDLSGATVLLPRAQIARRTLAERLHAAGASVDEVVAYQTLPAEGRLDPDVRALLMGKRLDWLTFTSASTARHFAQWIEQEGLEPKQVLKAVRVACIGPITAREAEALGLKVDVMAKEHTIGGLIDAILHYVRGEPIASN